MAVELLSKAVSANPAAAHFRSNLGLALTHLGRFDEAIASLRLAVQLAPNLADAHNNLGNALRRLGKTDEAIASFRTAIQCNPSLAEAHNNLAGSFRTQGKLDEAEAEFRTAIQLKPNLALAYSGLGGVLIDRGQPEQALANLQIAVRLDPRIAEAHHNIGNIFRSCGRLDQAEVAYRSAIQIMPTLAASHSNLGIVLRNQGRIDEAIASFRKAIELDPSLAGAFSNLGNVLKERNDVDDAIVAYETAIKLDPTIYEAYTNLGNTLKDVAELDAAVAMHRRAVELSPELPGPHSNLIYTLYFHPDFTQQMIHGEELSWARRHAEPLKQHIRPHQNDRDPQRPLRIGYVSPDFREHCQAFFTYPLFRNHDRRQFHITCYSSSLRSDSVTARLKNIVDEWRDIAGMSDQDAADLIRRDQIDILIDLTVHMAGNRLLVFARKPAPVQVTWLGYPGSTGMDAIDYRITDPYLDPSGTDETVYTERSIRLPDTFWCFDPLTEAVTVNDLPATTNGFITFGCLNNFSKVNRQVLQLWAKVLRAVPNSRLIILCDAGKHRDKKLTELKDLGVNPDRIQFEAKRPRIAYLELYNQVDMALDTFPYNGHTTSLDSLWMGVPTITLAGHSPVARAGLSLLSNLGLTEMIALEPEQYVKIATDWCSNLPRLVKLRASLRERMKASPLMDAPRFTRNFETALREMWREWCSKPA